MHSPPRILIVDDNETNRDILMARLGPQGYDLKQAADGEEALAAAKEHLPDLILLDIMMPKIDGIEVCKRIKNDAAMPFTPIILCTAKADSKDVVAGLEAGADEYLTKPIDQMALVARVKAALRLKQLHDQVTDMNRNLEQRVADQLGRKRWRFACTRSGLAWLGRVPPNSSCWRTPEHPTSGGLRRPLSRHAGRRCPPAGRSPGGCRIKPKRVASTGSRQGEDRKAVPFGQPPSAQHLRALLGQIIELSLTLNRDYDEESLPPIGIPVTPKRVFAAKPK